MKTALERATELIDNAPKETHQFFGGKSLIVSHLLPNGFTIDGRAGIVDLSQFDISKGLEICRRDAITQLCRILAYQVQSELHEQSGVSI